MTELFQNREIENQLADGNTGARRAVTRLENPVREILNRKIRIRRNVDKRFKRHLVFVAALRDANCSRVSARRERDAVAVVAGRGPPTVATAILIAANPRAAHRSYSCRTK